MTLVMSPHKVALMFVIYQYALGSGGSHAAEERELKASLGAWLSRALTARGDAAVSAWAGREPSLRELCASIDAGVRGGRTVTAALRLQLARVDSPDALLEAIQRYNNAFFADSPSPGVSVYAAPTGLALVSLCGLFQRAVSLAFVRLSFEATCSLFSDIVAYVRCADDADDDAAADDSADAAPGWLHLRSRHECEAVAAAELAALECGFGALSAANVERRLARLRRRVPALGKLFFLRFVSSLLHRAFDDALDALHSYFDSSVYYNRKSPAALREAAASGNAAAASEALAEKARRGAMLAYAALSLTRLHFAAGNVDSAREALAEATRIAQERAHMPSLATTLWWSARLQRAEHGRVASRRFLLRGFGVARTSDPTIATIADLELAESYCDAPPPPLPATPWTPPAAREALESSGSAAVAIAACARHLFRATLQPMARGSGDYVPHASLVRSAAWQAHGRAQLAREYARLALHQSTIDASLASPLSASCRLADALQQWQHVALSSLRPAAVEAAVHASLALMRDAAARGDFAGARHHRDAALTIAVDAAGRARVPQTELQVLVVGATRVLECERATRLGQLSRARRFAAASLGAARQDVRERLAARGRLAAVDVAAGRSERAYHTCVALQHESRERGLERESLAHSLTSCRALLAAGDIVGAQRSALACSAVASRLGATESLCAAQTLLARTFVHSGQAQRARLMGDALRVLAARCGGGGLLVDVELLRARAALADSATIDAKLAAAPLVSALATLERLGDLARQHETCALLAVLYDRCAMRAERNKMARRALALKAKIF
jgi:hypothetical protein